MRSKKDEADPDWGTWGEGGGNGGKKEKRWKRWKEDERKQRGKVEERKKWEKLEKGLSSKKTDANRPLGGGTWKMKEKEKERKGKRRKEKRRTATDPSWVGGCRKNKVEDTHTHNTYNKFRNRKATFRSLFVIFFHTYRKAFEMNKPTRICSLQT